MCDCVSNPEKTTGLLSAPAESLSLQASNSVFRSEGNDRPQRDHCQQGAAHEVASSCMEKLLPAFHLSSLCSASMKSLILLAVLTSHGLTRPARLTVSHARTPARVQPDHMEHTVVFLRLCYIMCLL